MVLDLTIPTPAKAMFQAELLYMQSPGVSLKEVWEIGVLDPGNPEGPKIREHVAFVTLMHRAKEESWPSRRKAFWIKIRDRVLAEAETSLVQEELRELVRFRDVRDRILDVIFGDADGLETPIPGRSLEGLAAVLVKVDERIQTKRERTAGLMARGAADPEKADAAESSTAIEVLDTNLTPEEARELAQVILKKRMNQGRFVEEKPGGRREEDE